MPNSCSIERTFLLRGSQGYDRMDKEGVNAVVMERISFQKPDLHMHSVYSDGTDTPENLLQNVRAAGLDLFALTDHDTGHRC